MLIIPEEELHLPNGILRNGIFEAIEQNLQARQFAVDRRGPQAASGIVAFLSRARGLELSTILWGERPGGLLGDLLRSASPQAYR
ncbi:MAG: hypothetical protein ABJC05_05945 [Pyrinomonadaceae bacterium]